MTRTLTVLTMALGVSATGALAATEMDTDGDGVYSFEEMLAAVPTLTEETFITIDANGDGAVDEAELAAAQESGLIEVSEG